MTPDAPLPMLLERRRAVTAGVLLGMCLAVLELTIIGTAMPSVIATLEGLKHYSWVFSAFSSPRRCLCRSIVRSRREKFAAARVF